VQLLAAITINTTEKGYHSSDFRETKLGKAPVTPGERMQNARGAC